MPAQTTQSQLPDDPEIGNLLQKHAKDKSVKPSTDLPGGIKDGIARLIDARLGKYQKGVNKDKTFLYLAGNVLDPEFVEDNGRKVKVRGRRTSQTLPLCATTGKKADENVQAALNHMKLLGGDKCTENVKKLGDLDALGKALVSKKIRFGFFTRKSEGQTKPDPKNPGKTITYEPRVWETWLGADEVPADYQDPKPQGFVAATTNGKPDPEPEAETQTEGDQGSPPDDDENQNERPEELPGDHEIDELVKQAEGEDTDARATLIRLAVQVGKTQEEAEAFASWSDNGEFIRETRNAAGSDEQETPAEEETPPEEPLPKTWKVGEVRKVKLMVKNAKGAIVPSKNFTEVKIKSIDKAKGSCVVTDLATKKEHKGIKLEALEEN